jgi:threonine dehydratase
VTARVSADSLERRDVEAAARRIAPFVRRTPLIPSPWLSRAAAADVSIKLESMQATGSFKARGAMHALLALREREPGAGAVVTASAGNHGLALAWAARHLGFTVRVHLPSTAPQAKRDGLAALGAELIDAPTYDEAEARAREDARTSGLAYVSPYNDPDVIAGAGTVALEMLDDRPDLDVIVAPLGGGGLLAGTAIVAGAQSSPTATIGAEVEASPVFTTALANGRITEVAVRPTLADGLAGNLEPHSATFALVERLVDRVVLVNEASLAAAMRGLVMHERLIAEGAGATAVAAVLEGGLGLAGRRVGVIVSGRNVDWEVLQRVLCPK